MADEVAHDQEKSVQNVRPQFGNRHLVDPNKVFEHNAWDNVEWDEEQEQEALKKITENSQQMVQPEMKEKYEKDAGNYWNDFYQQHQNRFFKDRHWLFTEFPELAPEWKGANNYNHDNIETSSACTGGSNTQKTMSSYPGDHARIRMLEVGCGAGNTVFPVLETNNDPNLFMYCCDFSKTAVDIVKSHSDYNPSRCHAFVCDVTSPVAEFPFPDSSLDIIILIFVLSAVDPDRMQFALERLCKFLKPGGLLLFRDYGRYDMAQLRFKKGRCLSDNFYVRGDGTRCYFFTQEEIKTLFEGAGMIEEQNYVDRRLQVNRGRQLKMYRVWMQCKYRKPSDA